MKNAFKIIFLIILSSSTASCQQKEFPELESKKIETRIDNPKYFEEQYENPETSKYFTFYKGIYEFATTKDNSIKEKKDNTNIIYPWEINVSLDKARDIIRSIEDTIYVSKDSYAEYKGTASGEINIVAPYVLKLTEKDRQEFESGSLRNSDNILDNINCKYISYNLKNENDEAVIIEQEYLGICNGGIHKKQDGLYYGFCMFNQSLEPKYSTLKGSIDIEIQVPIKYIVEEIKKNDVGKVFTIGGNKIKIIEFDANVFHYQLLQKGEEFKVEYNVGSKGELILSYDYYTKLRNNPKLTYQKVIEKKDFFEIDKYSGEYNEEVFVVKFDDKTTDVVYFYLPNYETKRIEVKVDIK